QLGGRSGLDRQPLCATKVQSKPPGAPAPAASATVVERYRSLITRTLRKPRWMTPGPDWGDIRIHAHQSAGVVLVVGDVVAQFASGRASPGTASVMDRWVMKWLGAAPCHCHSSAGV